MLLSKLVLLVLPLTIQAAAVSAPVSKRSFALLYSDLQDCDSKTNALTAAINACTCTTSQATAATNAEKALESAVQKVLDDCNADANQPKVSNSEAQQFIDYVNGPLLTDVTTLVNTLIDPATKNRLNAAGLGPIVRASLCRLRKLILAACACLKGRAPTSYQSAAQSACDKLIAQIDRAISSWGTATC